MLNIPDSPHPRIVIIGAGFAGFHLAKKLSRKNFQLVIIDKNNFHQFQPLFYQVAMSGLEPSSIVFPLRKAFQRNKNVFIRIAEVTGIDSDRKRIKTTLGEIYYNRCIIATGVDTNFFNSEELERNTATLKSIREALQLRNAILLDLEKALMTPDYNERQSYLDIVIVGGGPTGVELAGALAEMRKYILPKDYPELDEKEFDIYLVQSGDCLLKGMSDHASRKALEFLRKLNVHVLLGKRVKSYDGEYVQINDGSRIRARKVIWAAGVKARILDGLEPSILAEANRIRVDRHHRVAGYKDIYALGDIAYMPTDKYPDGHPQVAQAAIQQAKNLVYNFTHESKRDFEYKDLGSMATIGRNKAVADLPGFSFSGLSAWMMWLFVHLLSLIGFKNKFFVMFNWLMNYITYDQSLRLIIRTGSDSDRKQKD